MSCWTALHHAGTPDEVVDRFAHVRASWDRPPPARGAGVADGSPHDHALIELMGAKVIPAMATVLRAMPTASTPEPVIRQIVEAMRALAGPIPASVPSTQGPRLFRNVRARRMLPA